MALKKYKRCPTCGEVCVKEREFMRPPEPPHWINTIVGVYRCNGCNRKVFRR